ncbi:hypothetical protein MJ585_19760 [Klebsiella pneumoniae]|nr:hypothetical protein MJ585_19760 [Klebsiella pneumoniae]
MATCSSRLACRHGCGDAHLMTHAFFKALLFLASGSVILACHHEQNIFKMGGLRKSIPLVYLCFLVGGAALSAPPLVTAGFFSKDEISRVRWRMVISIRWWQVWSVRL